MPATIKVFYSYASEDEPWRIQLEKHLRTLERQKLITGWHAHKIVAGTDKAQEIEARLNEADIILLLISPDFTDSDYCWGIELKRAIDRHNNDETHVIPILVRPADYKGAPFEKLEPLPTNAEPITTWLNRDQAFLDVAQGIRVVVETLIEKLADNPSKTISTNATVQEKASSFEQVWNVPFHRNPFFTGREDTLETLHNILFANNIGELSQPLAISGLGGVGKTQTAIEYAYRYRDEYQYVLWIRADTRETLVADFVTIASLLNVSGKNIQDQSIIVGAVKRWLEAKTSWLLIFDNADDLQIIGDFLPSRGKGHILLTTRASATGEIAQQVEITEMEPEDGALFLMRRAKIIALNVPFLSVPEADRSKAKEIAEAVDGLPLALDQAGAFIEETECSLTDYLNLYWRQSTDLLKFRGGIEAPHPKPVATTWSLSFEKVEKANPASAELLRLCAFLHPDAIPEEIITDGSPELGPLLEPVAANMFKFYGAVKELRKFSLVRRDPTDKLLSIHRLVQTVLKDEMDENTKHFWAERTVRAVNRAFPDVEFATWHRCQRCLPHAQTCATLIRQWDMKFPEAARLLHQAGYYLFERAHYVEAELLLTRALAIREQVLGSEHLDVAQSLNLLANIYHDQSKYPKAETLFARSLTIREQNLGPKHPDVAQSLNDLAKLYYAQGKYAQVESVLQRALTILEQALGPEHIDVARTLNALGSLYQVQGKYVQAEPLYQQALAIREKILRPEHPDIAQSLNKLAELYCFWGKYIQAEPLFQRALIIREQALGLEHPDVATTLYDLAVLYYYQDQYGQAEPLIQRALTIFEQIIGPETYEVAISLNTLAVLYYKQDNYTQAEPLLQRALLIWERTSGSEHPNVAYILNNLGEIYYKQSKYDQAESFYQRSLTILRQAYGPGYYEEGRILHNLAELYSAQRKFDQAEPFYQQALAIREKELGPKHPEVANTLNNLARFYKDQGKYAEAEALYQRALSIREQALGPEHLKVVQSLEDYAALLRKTNREDEAIKMEARADAIRAKYAQKNPTDSEL